MRLEISQREERGAVYAWFFSFFASIIRKVGGKASIRQLVAQMRIFTVNCIDLYWLLCTLVWPSSLGYSQRLITPIGWRREDLSAIWNIWAVTTTTTVYDPMYNHQNKEQTDETQNIAILFSN